MGANVGDADGATVGLAVVGAAVGTSVAMQLVSLSLPVANPSKQAHDHLTPSPAAFTQ